MMPLGMVSMRFVLYQSAMAVGLVTATASNAPEINNDKSPEISSRMAGAATRWRVPGFGGRRS